MHPFTKNISGTPIRKSNSLIVPTNQEDLTGLTASAYFEERIQKAVESYLQNSVSRTKSVCSSAGTVKTKYR